MKETPLNYISPLVKSQATDELIALFSPYVTYERIPAGQRLYFCIDEINMCYLLLSGVIKVCRATDALVIATMPSPNITGISSLLPASHDLFLETQSDSFIGSLTTQKAYEIIEQYNAWELLASHVTRVTANLFKRYVIMTAPTTYDILKFQLMSLMQEPEDLRLATSTVKYITERTRLSRSTIMKMLAQLKKGGYIVMDEGILIAINNFPDKY